VALPGDLAASCEGADIRLGVRRPCRHEDEGGDEELILTVPGRVLWRGTSIEARIVAPASVQADRWKAYLDLTRVTGTLAVRGRRAGDRFVPLGSSGATTLKRFFIDRKIPLAERARIPIVVLDDLPIWVAGERIDDRMKVTAETRDVLELRAIPAAAPGDLP
jgi:tRNA(Ile)-lysidine synthetase-like protein